MSEVNVQQRRLLQLKAAPEFSHFILTTFKGTDCINRPFEFKLELTHTQASIDAANFLNHTCTVVLQAPDGELQYFNGIINQLTLVPVNKPQLSHIKATLVPWLATLALNKETRIFQNKSVIEIFTLLCQELGFSDYDVKKIMHKHPKLDYCVQYNETSLAFLQRILNHSGIFYYFTHTPTKHILHLIDDAHVLPHCPQDLQVDHTASARQAHLSTWETQQQLSISTVTFKDYDYLNPRTPLTASTTMQHPLLPHAEAYFYPGHYQHIEQGKRLSQQQQDAEQNQSQTFVAKGNILGLYAGLIFKLDQTSTNTQQSHYLIRTIHYDVIDKSHIKPGTAQQTLPSQHFTHTFICAPTIPTYAPMRPAKPRVYGSQTATVTGPKNKEIYTDKHGRAKVQFHWDRQGQFDAHSSCWLRVAQMATGKRSGMQFLPRIGQEVLVSFINADPDRPVITGSLYNALNLPPYPLPSMRHRSGIRSHTLHSMHPTDANEIYFDDNKDQEIFNLTAQRDFLLYTKNASQTSIQNNQVLQIDGQHLIRTQGQATIAAHKALQLQTKDGVIHMTPDHIAIKSHTTHIGALLATLGLLTAGVIIDVTGLFMLWDGVGEMEEVEGTELAAKAAKEFEEAGKKDVNNLTPQVGQKVYRVWGDEAKPFGRSWTRTNPDTVSNYRKEAGLPKQNTGRFVSEGTLKNISNVEQREALSLHGNEGGLDELVVPNPEEQVETKRISGVNPSF